METSASSSTGSEISVKKAAIIVGIVLIAVICLGLFIGNKFFWNQFNTTTKEEVAFQRAQQLVKAKPNSAVAHVTMGYQYLLKGDRKSSEKEYLKAYSLNSKDNIVLFNMGVAYAHWKEYDKTITYLSQLVKKAPYHFEGHFNLGVAYYEKGNIDKAIEEYKLALRTNKGAADVYYNLAKAYQKKGDKKQALEAVNKAVQFVPDYKEAVDLKKELER